MKKLNQYHFYYGAILNSIFEFNHDASPTLLEATDKRGIYKIITNTSNKEYVAFCKYAFQQENKNPKYQSWKFVFTEEDKECLKTYHEKQYPVFIYFLCGNKELKNSEIAICSYEELTVVLDKKTITLSKEKHKSYFNLHVEKSRSTSIHLNRSRIEQKVDDIIDEIINFSPEHYKKDPKSVVKIALPVKQDKKQYIKPTPGQYVRFLSISYRDDDICPIHNDKMQQLYVHLEKLQDVAYYCPKCGKYMIPKVRYDKLIKTLKRSSNNITFDVILKTNE